MEKIKEFWMCYVAGGNQPTFKHEAEILAENEAKRLAEVTQKRCYVLKTVQAFEPAPKVVKIEIISEKEDLPFQL